MITCFHCHGIVDTEEMYVHVPELDEYYHVECFYTTHDDIHPMQEIDKLRKN